LVMGAALNAQGKFEQALQVLERGEALAPNAWQAYFESGRALLSLGKFQDALHKVNKAFTLTDVQHHPELHLLKGYVYLGLNAYTAALPELETYVNQEPGGANALEARSAIERIRPLATGEAR